MEDRQEKYRLGAGNLFTGEYPNRVEYEAQQEFVRRYIPEREFYFDGTPTGSGALVDANWIIDIGTGLLPGLIKGLATKGVISAIDIQAVESVAAEGGIQYSELVKAAQKLYPNKAGVTGLHHIAPKYLGGAVDGS